MFFIQAEGADYDEMPIDKFGLAMLRGMGWKEGQGIGKRHERYRQFIYDTCIFSQWLSWLKYVYMCTFLIQGPVWHKCKVFILGYS